jgi:copper/silver efflux system protein
MRRLAAWSACHPWIVVGAALLLALAGEMARRSLARDVIPDLSDPQIGVVADWMDHPAAEVAGSITGALTRELEGVAGSTAVRGTSMPGMAYVDIVFDASADLAAGRRAIVERVARARPGLPANARLQVGPAASSTGWVFQYVLVDPHHHESTLTLGRIQDDILRPAIASLPGVAEVASVGGGVQQMVIEVRQDQLRARSAALSDVVSTLRSALVPGGAAHASASVDDILALPVAGAPAAGAPPTIRDLASVRIDDDTPTGLADFDGVLRAVGGIVVAERGADPAAVAGRVKRALEPLRARLPPGVQLVTVYDREALVGRVGATLLRALAEEIGVVVLVILLFLLHGRSALVPLVTLPVVLLLTFGATWILGLPATLMSLGGMGIALGLAVDADVVALEACHRRVEAAPDSDRRSTLIAAAGAFAPAILTSLLITALAFLPVFAFTGETGRLLRPLAATKTLVIAAAALVSLTLAPALRDRLLAGRLRAELDNPITRWLVRAYRPFVHFALARPLVTLLTAALAVASCLPILSRLGGEFLPRIDEGDLLFMPTTMPGVPAEAAALQLDWQARMIAGFGEVATVFGKVGRAGTATDPAPYSMAELTIRLRPRSEWPAVARPRWYSAWAPGVLRRALRVAWPEETPSTTAELVERLDRATRLPGWTSAWTAPVRARMDMMSTNMRTPVGLRVVAATPGRLDAVGPDIRTIVSRVPGTRSAVFESFGGEARLELAIDPAAVARHGVDPALARSTADLLLTGGQLGDVERPGERDAAAIAAVPADPAGGAGRPTLLRVRVQPTLGEAMRGLVDQVREATVRASGANADPVPLALLGHATYETRPAALRTEHGEPVAYVYVDLGDGTDIARFIARAQHELDDAIAGGRLRLDPGERLEWAGQYELLEAGERRLTWIVPTVALSMLALLILLFRSLTEALIVLVSVPFALVGSFWALFLAGYPLSAPVWVGLLSVLGLAMQTGVVMVVYIDEAFHRRVREGRIATRDDIVAAHAEGTVQRLRPKLMTIATMAAGLLPLVWADGAGAEIMRRVAVPMIGGLATSAFLTLEVLPVLYTIWRHRQLLRARRAGVAVEAIIGSVPGWARPAWQPNAHP